MFTDLQEQISQIFSLCFKHSANDMETRFYLVNSRLVTFGRFLSHVAKFFKNFRSFIYNVCKAQSKIHFERKFIPRFSNLGASLKEFVDNGPRYNGSEK